MISTHDAAAEHTLDDRKTIDAPNGTDKISMTSTSCAQIRGQVGFV